MTKRYAEPIDVEAPEGSVEAFWWRGKRYAVRQIHCRWREAGGWWEGDRDDSRHPRRERPAWQYDDAREIFRLDAIPTTNGLAAGTYEIAHDLRTGAWILFRVMD